MGYVLRGLLVEHARAERVAAALRGTRPIRLDRGLALVPLPRETLIELGEPDEQPYALLDGESLPEGLVSLLKESSVQGAVAYVEAEFFGGTGQQGSAVWEHGSLALGPIVDPADTEPAPPLRECAINRALRHLGIDVDPRAVDEFDTVGLGRHRDTDDWLS